MERDLNFYRNVFGNSFAFKKQSEKSNFVKVINVDDISIYKQTIIQQGGSLTVPKIELSNKQIVIYYSDPDGNIFALLEKH